MLTKITTAVAVLGAGGYMFHAAGPDPTVFPQPREQVQQLLLAARTALPRRDGTGSTLMWSPRETERGLLLNMQSATWAPVVTCRIAVLAVSPASTRVVPECGSDGTETSARARTLAEIFPFMFEEHIDAILNKRPFSRDAVDRKTVAVYTRNLGALQREARSLASRTDQAAVRPAR